LDFAGKGLVDIEFDDLLSDGEPREVRLSGSATLAYRVAGFPVAEEHVTPDGQRSSVKLPCRVRFRIAKHTSGEGGF
jgi:hypothetical protein